jgi:hypothetical protein
VVRPSYIEDARFLKLSILHDQETPEVRNGTKRVESGGKCEKPSKAIRRVVTKD